MIIIGADYHPGFQQIAFVDSETGELNELRLRAPRGSGEVLSRARGPRDESARGDGSQWARALV